MGEPFTKLLSSILSSTVWLEDDQTVRVWITMLAMADAEGYVGASVPGLAHTARVPVEACRRALEKFEAPDPDSRSQEHDGRRIVRVDRGWTLLNYRKIRAMHDAEEKRLRDRERKRRERALSADVHVCPAVSAHVQNVAQAEAEAEAEEEGERENARAREERLGGPRATRPWPEVDGEPAGSSTVARALLTEALALTPRGADELRPAKRSHIAAMERLLGDGESAEEIQAILAFAAASVTAGTTDPKWWGPRMLEPGPWQRWRGDYARRRAPPAPPPTETLCAAEERDGEPPLDPERVREILGSLAGKLKTPHHDKEQPT